MKEPHLNPPTRGEEKLDILLREGEGEYTSLPLSRGR